IVLHEAKPEAVVASLRVTIAPGSRTTGITLMNDTTGEIVWAAEVAHRGHAVHEALVQRREVRHARRGRKTRYRPPRFQNRRRPEGWLPPSLASRIHEVLTWVERLRRLVPSVHSAWKRSGSIPNCCRTRRSVDWSTSTERWQARRSASTCCSSGGIAVPTAIRKRPAG